MTRIALITLVLACAAWAQPDAPSALQPPPERKCGPKWAGGCWDSSRISSWHDTLHDKKWWIPTLTALGATTFDYTMTARGAPNWYPGLPKCVEGNPNLGQNPTAGDFARDFAETHVPVFVLGTLIHKVSRTNRYASWIYPGMMAYMTQVHVRGGIGWFGCQ